MTRVNAPIHNRDHESGVLCPQLPPVRRAPRRAVAARCSLPFRPGRPPITTVSWCSCITQLAAQRDRTGQACAALIQECSRCQLVPKQRAIELLHEYRVTGSADGG
jgi:hypothetical protein